MGMTNNQVQLIRCIAENKLQDAKSYAIACCAEDITKKNEAVLKKYKTMLKNSQENNVLEIPFNLQGIIQVKDKNSFKIERYYLTENEKCLFNKIKTNYNAADKFAELEINFNNSILLKGQSGTGKTTFGEFVANQLNLPFIYINFSCLVDSLMGNTSKNIRKVFEFAKMNECVLMLDELDAIGGQRRSSLTGADRERANSTISLLQELDQMSGNNVIIGATNIPDEIDEAIKRRFSIHYSFSVFSSEDNEKMIIKYINGIGLSYDEENIKYFVNLGQNIGQSQGTLLAYVNQCIAAAVVNNKEKILL